MNDFWIAENSRSEQGTEGVEYLLLLFVRGLLEINSLQSTGCLPLRVSTKNAAIMKLATKLATTRTERNIPILQPRLKTTQVLIVKITKLYSAKKKSARE